MPVTSMRLTTAGHEALRKAARDNETTCADITDRAVKEYGRVDKFRREVTSLISRSESTKDLLALIASGSIDPDALLDVLRKEVERSEILIGASIRLLSED